LQDTDGRLLEQVLLGMRNRDQPRFGRVLEVMVTASDTHQVPTIRNNLALSRIGYSQHLPVVLLVVTIPTDEE
jgi:hypothetical protein